MKFADIKNDIAFRKIFGNDNKKEILISFLNAILGFTNDRKIVTVSILNPFQLPELLQYKTTVIDIKASDQKGHYYIIEMQVADKGNFDKRIQYYSSKAYNAQIVKGEDYHLLKPTIFIGILNFNFLASKTYLTKHIICNPDTKEQVLKDFEYNFIELLKFNNVILECNNLIDKWLYFIKNAENLEVIPDNINDEGLSEAYHDADQMTWSPKELELYDYSKMRERDEYEERKKAVEKAVEKEVKMAVEKEVKMAVENAVKMAVENAVENEKNETVKELYNIGISIDNIAIATKLSRENVKQILNIND